MLSGSIWMYHRDGQQKREPGNTILSVRQYLSLPPTRQDLTQGLSYSRGFEERWGQAQAKIHALLDYVGHWLTGCNVSQMTQLGVGHTKYNMIPARMSSHSLNLTWRPSAMLCCQWFFAHPKMTLLNLGPFGLKSIIDLEPHLALLPDGPAKKLMQQVQMPFASCQCDNNDHKQYRNYKFSNNVYYNIIT